jgi:hypothetical protein
MMTARVRRGLDPGQEEEVDPELMDLAAAFDARGIVAVALAGSYARNEAGPYSDVDLIRFVAGAAKPQDDGSHLIHGRLVVVSSLTSAEVEATFTAPEVTCNMLAGLRTARPLIDRDGAFARISGRAARFRWDAAMQARADRYAGEQLVGWIEEVHKGLEGLRRNDIGRLLNARFGLSWGLSGVVKVQRGVLLSGDNGAWDEINRAVGEGTHWVRLRAQAFGISGADGRVPSLQDQVRAGLALYVETVQLMEDALPMPQREMVLATVMRIKQSLNSV